MKPREFYKQQAKELLQQKRLERGRTYRDLAAQLPEHGVHMNNRTLKNRINRGTFTFSFALQVLAALGVRTLKIPKMPKDPAPGDGVAFDIKTSPSLITRSPQRRKRS